MAFTHEDIDKMFEEALKQQKTEGGNLLQQLLAKRKVAQEKD